MNNKKFKSIRNNAYAVKTIWSISKSRVLHTAANTAGGYVAWIFYSIFFVRYLINAIMNEASFGTIMLFVGICFAVFCAKSLYDSYYKSYVLPLTDNKVYRKLYEKLYAKARNVELRCYENAEFYSRYTMALENSAEKMTTSVRCFFAIVFGIAAEVVAFTSIYLIDPLAVLFVAFPVFGNLVIGSKLSKIFNARYAENVKPTRAVGYVNRVIHLSEFAKEVRCSNIFEVMMNRYENAVKEICVTFDKYGRKAVALSTLHSFLSYTVVFEGIMLYAAYRAIVSQTLSLAELAIMFSAMVPCSWILIGLSDNIRDALANAKYLQYFRGFMEYKESIPEDSDGESPDISVSSIEFRNVSFEYNEDEKIIDNLSFTITANQIVAFVGHNGAGKTTIMKLLFRLYDPTSGEILVNGINIKRYNLKAYRNLFAAAFQDYKIMSMSVSENILMGDCGDNRTDERTVEESLKRAGIFDKVQKLPSGIDTILTKEFDEDGAVLSGGEIQKIIVARAFAKNSPVKVFDEPSSALDPIAEYELYRNIMEQSDRHDITFFISHRLSTVKDADIVFMLENGAVAEVGTHSELMSQNGVYCKMYTMQAQNYLAVENAEEVAAV